jgi:hypothetical protein
MAFYRNRGAGSPPGMRYAHGEVAGKISDDSHLLGKNQLEFFTEFHIKLRYGRRI